MRNFNKGRSDLTMLDTVRYRKEKVMMNMNGEPFAYRLDHPERNDIYHFFEPSYYYEMEALYEKLKSGELYLGGPKGEKSSGRQICNKCGHLYLHTGNLKCLNCNKGGRSNRALARDKGERWYVPEEECERCTSNAPRRVHDNVCSQCADITPLASGRTKRPKLLSNRQRSMQSGFKFFIAENPCDTCGCTTIRRTANSQCMFCNTSNKLAYDSTYMMIMEQPVDNEMVSGDAVNGYVIKC